MQIGSEGKYELLYKNLEHYHQMKGVAFYKRNDSLFIQLKFSIAI